MYGSSTWGNITSKQNLTRLLKLQKRAARVILNKNTRESRTVDLFKSLNWLLFVQEIKVNQCSLLMKWLQGQVPEYLETKFTRIRLVMSPPEQPVTQEKLFTARGIIGKLREGVLLSPKLLNLGTRYQIN